MRCSQSDFSEQLRFINRNTLVLCIYLFLRIFLPCAFIPYFAIIRYCRVHTFSDCCKTILVNLEGRDHPYKGKLSGMKNGHPMWSREGGQVFIYFENGKWIIGGQRYSVSEKYHISDSSPKCPESVESWSDGPGNIGVYKLEGGKLECDSMP